MSLNSHATHPLANSSLAAGPGATDVPITVLIAAKNEACNIRQCLRSLQWADQVCVVDSQSTDETIDIAVDEGADVFQFHYDGGWPKKRNWALENLPIRNEWVLSSRNLLTNVMPADAILMPSARCE